MGRNEVLIRLAACVLAAWFPGAALVWNAASGGQGEAASPEAAYRSAVCAVSPEATTPPPASQRRTPAPAPPTSHPLPGVVDDSQILRNLETQANRLLEDNKTVPAADLIAELGRTQCQVELAKPATKPLPSGELYERCKKSVLVVAGIFKCEKCKRMHAGPASGFVISASGVAVTNHHVVNNAKNVTLVAMTSDGVVHAVKEVLAASPVTDVAIVQLEGTGFTPLPVVAQMPVGSDIFVLSHPDRCFFTLTRGIVSRYGTIMRERRRVPMLQITAQYAKGSSGGPVLSTAGEVVGMVSSTSSIYYNEDHGKQENLQMVLNRCVPAAHILDLIKP